MCVIIGILLTESSLHSGVPSNAVAMLITVHIQQFGVKTKKLSILHT
jgi:hypothetical protein